MTQRRVIQNEYPYLLTSNVRGGEPFFEDAGHAKALAKIIRTTCELKHFALLAYSIMPEHVHIVVSPVKGVGSTRNNISAAAAGRSGSYKNPRARAALPAAPYTVSDLMHGIKSYFVYALRNGSTMTVFAWQPRFNSRILNTEDYLRSAIEYVHFNPKKAGLPARYCKQPYLYVDDEQVNSLF